MLIVQMNNRGSIRGRCDTGCSVDDSGRCFGSSKTKNLPANDRIEEVVSHQKMSERRSVPATPPPGPVMQMQCPCVFFDGQTHPGVSNSNSPIHSCKTLTHVSSTPSTPPIASSHVRLCALARASPALPAFKRVAMSRQVIWLWKCLRSCSWARRWDIAFKRVCVGQRMHHSSERLRKP